MQRRRQREQKEPWVAQLVKSPILGFDSGHDLRVLRSSPKWGSTLSSESVGYSLSPSAPLANDVSLSKINRSFLKAIYLFDSTHWRGSGRGRSRLPAEQGARYRAQSQDPRIMT